MHGELPEDRAISKLWRHYPAVYCPVGIAAMFSGFRDDRLPQSRDEKQTRQGSVYWFDSGKSALAQCLHSMRRTQPDRSVVVIPAYTCFSVVASIVAAGLKCRVCEMRTDTLDFDFDDLGRVVDQDTLAVISTHLCGLPLDLRRAQLIASQAGAFHIVDAAQRGNDPSVPLASDAILYSYGRGKPVNAGGGGAIEVRNKDVASDPALAKFAIVTRDRITTIKKMVKLVAGEWLSHPLIFGIPARIPAIGIGKTVYPVVSIGSGDRLLRSLVLTAESRLAEVVSHRREISRIYLDRLAAARGDHLLPKGLLSPTYAGNRFPLLTDVCVQTMHSAGVVRMYPSTLVDAPEIPDAAFDGARHARPGAGEIARRLVTLPTHPRVSRAMANEICDALEDRFVSKTAKGVS